MIGPDTAGSHRLSDLSPSTRAELIFRTARGKSDEALWRAALGSSGAAAPTPTVRSALDLASLVETLLAAEPNVAVPVRNAPAEIAVEPFMRWEASGVPIALGPNAVHGAAIVAAAKRTGVPAPALAAMVDAEAAKAADGRWNVASRNPRSSASGLGQFLAGTWIGEAERPGSWLHRTAGESGWLDARGRVIPAANASLLALRFDPSASIEATADYARRNLDRFEEAGVTIGRSTAGIAQAAYLGHHLGPGDALAFLRGGLSNARAERLLVAQVGANSAARRISEAGEASVAHRDWLLAFVAKRVRTERFAAA